MVAQFFGPRRALSIYRFVPSLRRSVQRMFGDTRRKERRRTSRTTAVLSGTQWCVGRGKSHERVEPSTGQSRGRFGSTHRVAVRTREASTGLLGAGELRALDPRCAWMSSRLCRVYGRIRLTELAKELQSIRPRALAAWWLSSDICAQDWTKRIAKITIASHWARRIGSCDLACWDEGEACLGIAAAWIEAP